MAAICLGLNELIKKSNGLSIMDFISQTQLGDRRNDCMPIAVIAVIGQGVMGSILVRTNAYFSVIFIVHCCQRTGVCTKLTHINIMPISVCMNMYMYIYVYNLIFSSVHI